MGHSYDYDQSQNVFREIHPLQLLEEEHPARVIEGVVELMDLSELAAHTVTNTLVAGQPQLRSAYLSTACTA